MLDCTTRVASTAGLAEVHLRFFITEHTWFQLDLHEWTFSGSIKAAYLVKSTSVQFLEQWKALGSQQWKSLSETIDLFSNMAEVLEHDWFLWFCGFHLLIPWITLKFIKSDCDHYFQISFETDMIKLWDTYFFNQSALFWEKQRVQLGSEKSSVKTTVKLLTTTYSNYV